MRRVSGAMEGRHATLKLRMSLRADWYMTLCLAHGTESHMGRVSSDAAYGAHCGQGTEDARVASCAGKDEFE